MQVIGYLAGVAIVDAYAGGCVLGSGRKLERGRLSSKISSIKISAEGREIRDQSATRYVFDGSTCDMYSSSSCEEATRIL